MLEVAENKVGHENGGQANEIAANRNRNEDFQKRRVIQEAHKLIRGTLNILEATVSRCPHRTDETHMNPRVMTLLFPIGQKKHELALCVGSPTESFCIVHWFTSPW